jgi:hypothetical protein
MCGAGSSVPAFLAHRRGFGEATRAVGNHGEPAYEDVAGVCGVRRATDTGEVVGLWGARGTRITWSIHVSASSKLAKR